MQSAIHNILAPVAAMSSDLSFLRQAAALAHAHQARLYIAYIEDSESWWDTFFYVNDPKETDIARLPYGEQYLLYNWKKMLEEQYGVTVILSSQKGEWKKCVLLYAEQISADLIAIGRDAKSAKKGLFTSSPLEYIINKSNCQVVTFLSEGKEMSQWKDIVMPVTDCVPEARIGTLARLVGSLYMKVHLVTPSKQNTRGQNEDFYLVTETIKRLKPSGHIQVECRFLPGYATSARDFLDYSHLVHADILITNLTANRQTQPQPAEPYFILPYA